MLKGRETEGDGDREGRGTRERGYDVQSMQSEEMGMREGGERRDGAALWLLIQLSTRRSAAFAAGVWAYNGRTRVDIGMAGCLSVTICPIL